MSSVKTFYITKNNSGLDFWNIFTGDRPKAVISNYEKGLIVWVGDRLTWVYHLDNIFPNLVTKEIGISVVEVEEHEDCYVLRRVV